MKKIKDNKKFDKFMQAMVDRLMSYENSSRADSLVDVICDLIWILREEKVLKKRHMKKLLEKYPTHED